MYFVKVEITLLDFKEVEFRYEILRHQQFVEKQFSKVDTVENYYSLIDCALNSLNDFFKKERYGFSFQGSTFFTQNNPGYQINYFRKDFSLVTKEFNHVFHGRNVKALQQFKEDLQGVTALLKRDLSIKVKLW